MAGVTGSQVAGRKLVINIDLNDVGGAGANWAKVAQRRGGSLGRTSETADATHADDDGWRRSIITTIGWTVSADGILKANDPAWLHLKAVFEDANEVYVQIDASPLTGGEKVEGLAVITNLSYEFPQSDVVPFTIELTGNGALTASP